MTEKIIQQVEKNVEKADEKMTEIGDKHFSMVRNFYLADLITLMNGVCGVQSILSSMRYVESNNSQDLWMAIYLMPMGMFFDIFDGRVARWRNNSSLLGQELDSLADVISFGVAPAVLAYAIGMRTFVDSIALTYFVCCGISRLARYNATVAAAPKDATGKVHHFEGTPIPTSLGVVGVMAFLVYQEIEMSVISVTKYVEIHPIILLYIISGTLMISKTLRIPKF